MSKEDFKTKTKTMIENFNTASNDAWAEFEARTDFDTVQEREDARLQVEQQIKIDHKKLKEDIKAEKELYKAEAKAE